MSDAGKIRYARAQYFVHVRFLAVAAPLIVLAAWVCGVSAREFLNGLARGGRVVAFFFPPQWSAIPEMLEPAAVTLLLAFTATPLGAAISFILALGASRNLSPCWLRPICRSVIALERGLPEIVTVVVFAAAFGMGALPGVLALAIGSIGMLGKLMADAIEDVDAQVTESVRAVGASTWQAIRYAVLPEALPALIAATIFRFEVNIRSSVVIGAIGAGGLGYEINGDMHTFDYDRACIGIVTTLILVFASERMSTRLRARILGSSLP